MAEDDRPFLEAMATRDAQRDPFTGAELTRLFDLARHATDLRHDIHPHLYYAIEPELLEEMVEYARANCPASAQSQQEPDGGKT